MFKGELNSFADFFKEFLNSLRDAFANAMTDLTDLYVKQFLSNMMGKSGSSSFGDLVGTVFGKVFGGSGTTGSGKLAGADRAYASGGMITEPVMGLGLNTGKSYSFAENGAEGIFNQSQMKNLGSGNMAVSVNVINQSSQPVQAESRPVRFDGKKYIIDTIITDLATGGKLRTALGN